MAQIQINNLTFAYPGAFDEVFTDVSVTLDSSWKLGLIGRNGRGKTTLLRLLMGQYPYKGTIASDLDFEYFPFEVKDKAQLVWDMVQSVYPEAARWQIERELNLLDVKEGLLDVPFQTLSMGERTKVMLATLMLKPHAFLLIDEPTNHLDVAGRAVLARYLSQKQGFILVSHDRAVLDVAVDHIMAINRSDIRIEQGNYSSWAENKRREDAFELAQNEKLSRDIKRLQEAARRTASWSDKAEGAKIGFDPRRVEKSAGRRPYEGEKSRKLMARAKATEKRRNDAVAEKAALLHNIDSAQDLKIFPQRYVRNTLAYGKNISLSYGERQVFSDISFTIENGDRLALSGPNGCGKSSLVKLLCGHEASFTVTGAFYRGNGLVISYVSQDTAHLAGSLRHIAQAQEIDYSLFLTILRKLAFEREQFDKDARALSEGQKKKVLIAASLCTRAHLYVWDEPLNYIDILSRGQIEDLILTYQPTMVFVEHDRQFLNTIATKRLHFGGDDSALQARPIPL